VLATSQASEVPSFQMGTELSGQLLLNEANPSQRLNLRLATTPSSAGGSSARGTLTLEVSASYTPPVGVDPGAGELMVGLAQGNFLPEGQGKALGTPIAGTPLLLSATRGTLVSCELSLGCEDLFDLHLVAASLAAGAELSLSWTINAAIEGQGRATPPPGVSVTLENISP